MDFYLDYAAHPEARIRVGQSKIPFTRYRIQSFKNLQFVDWAITTKYFGAERQAGSRCTTATKSPGGSSTRRGSTPESTPGRPTRGGSRFSPARTIENPSDLVDGSAIDEFHPAVALHLAYNHAGIVTSYDTDFAGGGFRFMAGVSGVWTPTRYRTRTRRCARRRSF